MKIKIDVDADRKSFCFENYKLTIPITGDLKIERNITENELKILLDDIAMVLGYKEIMEKFNCNVKEARIIKEKIYNNNDCHNCNLKMQECYKCCIICQSPLEQALFKELTIKNINAELQLRINKDGSTSHYPEPVDKNKILTIPDFYVETEDKKICIYTDGHTYHERTEYQAVRDRSIDRELQNLGYIVLRYTTSEINQKLDDTVENIKKTMGI